jgi:hypothetical protein
MAKPRVEPEAEAETDWEHFDTFGTLQTLLAQQQRLALSHPTFKLLDDKIDAR